MITLQQVTTLLDELGIEYRVTEQGKRTLIITKEVVQWRDNAPKQERIAWASWNPTHLSADLKEEIREKLKKRGYGIYEVLSNGRDLYSIQVPEGRPVSAPSFIEAVLKVEL